MTPTDALAAALRERLVDGRPAPLPGLGTLVRQHVSARVEERPDGTRVLLPPGETIGLEAGDESGASIAEAVGRHHGSPEVQADAILSEAMDEVEAALAASGEARLRGVGLLRRTAGGIVLGVEAALLESVNRAYEGLAPIPTRPAPGGEATPPEPTDVEAGEAPPAAEEPAAAGEAEPRAPEPLEVDGLETHADVSPGGEVADPSPGGEAEVSARDEGDAANGESGAGPEDPPSGESTDDLTSTIGGTMVATATGAILLGAGAAPPEPAEGDLAEGDVAESEPLDDALPADPEPPTPVDETGPYPADPYPAGPYPAGPYTGDTDDGSELDLSTLLPHPTDDEGGVDEHVDDGSIAPSAPPPPSTFADYEVPDFVASPRDEAATPDAEAALPADLPYLSSDDVLAEMGGMLDLDEGSERSAPDAPGASDTTDGDVAVPFGTPDDPPLAEALPPTPSEIDPSETSALDDGTLADDGPANEAAPDEAPAPDEGDDWMSETWTAPRPDAPTLGEPPAPTFEEAELLDDGSSADPIVAPDAEAPIEMGPGRGLPVDDIADLAVPSDAPPLDIVPPPAPPVRERRVPVDRVGPPVGAVTPPPVEALAGAAPPPPDRRARDLELTRSADVVDEGRSFPWWVLGVLALLAVIALAWWLVSRTDADEPATPVAATQEEVRTSEPASAQPPDDLLAPSTVEDAVLDPNDTPPAPEPADDAAAAPPPAGQPPRVPGGEGTDAAAAPSAAPTDGVANLPPPSLAGLNDDDRAAIAGGAVDPSDRSSWTFVVASLLSRADADQVRRRYSEAGYKAAVLPLAEGFHRVGVGQFRSQAQALRLRDRLPPQAPPDTWVLSLRDL